jgi:thiosulfate dehydrogenase [quinone] large subunit
MKQIEIAEPKISRFLFSNTGFSWFWLIVRLYLGYDWLLAGWAKFQNPVWTGEGAGVAVSGFLNNALAKTSGPHPDVSAWYGYFIEHIALPHATFLSYLVTYGELAVGLGLILGLFTGIAAFFGTVMNANYLFAGTVSSNPIMLILQILLILAWKTAGWFGLDRFVLPLLGTPWQPGNIFKKK